MIVKQIGVYRARPSLSMQVPNSNPRGTAINTVGIRGFFSKRRTTGSRSNRISGYIIAQAVY